MLTLVYIVLTPVFIVLTPVYIVLTPVFIVLTPVYIVLTPVHSILLVRRDHCVGDCISGWGNKDKVRQVFIAIY